MAHEVNPKFFTPLTDMIESEITKDILDQIKLELNPDIVETSGTRRIPYARAVNRMTCKCSVKHEGI